MKKISAFILSLFLTSTLIGQELKTVCSFAPKFEDERIEDIQVLPEAIYYLSSYSTGNAYKRTYEHFVLYKFDKTQSKVTEQVLDVELEKQEGLQFVCFLNDTWYYLTEKEIDSYTFEYALLSINTAGMVDKKLFKTIELPKSSRKHVDEGKAGLIGHGYWLEPLGGVRFAQTKKAFLVSIRISHTSLLAFVFNPDGTLKFEKEISFVNEGEKLSTSEVLAIDAALMDENDNLYFVLSKFGEDYSRYCSVVNDEVFSVKEAHSKKRINSALFSNANDISALTLSNNGNNVTAFLNTFQDGAIKLESEFEYDFGDYIFLNKESIAKKDAQVFLSTKTKMIDNSDYLSDLVLFSLSKNGIENIVQIDRLLYGSYEYDIRAQVWPNGENYYVLFNSGAGRTKALGGLMSNKSLFITKLNSQLKEIKTNELNFDARVKFTKQVDNKIYMIVSDDVANKIISLDLSSM